MIRPEKYQFNWKPKTKSKEDLELVKILKQLVKDQNISKTQLTRKALVKYCNEIEKYSDDSNRHFIQVLKKWRDLEKW